MENIDAYRKFIKEKEGKPFLKAKKVFEHEKFLTLGYGDYGEHIKEGQTITVPEADAKLDENIRIRLAKIKKAIPAFDSMPENARVDLFASWFRGGLSGSPKTIKLINEGNYEAASKEFLNNEEYKNTKLKGIKDRMNQTSNIINSLVIKPQSKVTKENKKIKQRNFEPPSHNLFLDEKSREAFMNVVNENDLMGNQHFLKKIAKDVRLQNEAKDMLYGLKYSQGAFNVVSYEPKNKSQKGLNNKKINDSQARFKF